MPNDSSTGGYLAPSTTVGELNDQALRRFLQQLVVGITGLPGQNVRPRWQADPPNIPDFGTDWAAIGTVKRKRDTFATVLHRPGDNGGAGDDLVYRNQILDIMCSFYGPDAEANSELLSMGFQVSQNREAMQLSGFGLVSCDDAITAPDMLHERWVPRIDITFQLRRTQVYEYPVVNVLSAQGTIQDDTGKINESFKSANAASFPLFGFDLNTNAISGLDQGNWR